MTVMRVVTFYSYKGGVGRTLACANFGLYAAKIGLRVVLADMDFEAPGLDAKFAAPSPKRPSGGLLDQFHAFQTGAELPRLEAMEVPLPDDVTRLGGRLHLLPAGDTSRPDYFTKLSALTWDGFLSEAKGGMQFCLDLVRRVEEAFGADLLVIDSRTGLTEVGGICTQLLPDTVILLTCMSSESITGTQQIFKRVQRSPVARKRTGGRGAIDLRVVIARVPRPDDLPPFDEEMRRRIDLPVDRVYYLFDQRDLSTGDYLALHRLSDEHPAILDDYVELFTSLSPETNIPYIEKRLEAFRSGITLRSLAENERFVQELLTLFPLPEVVLEAARYARIVRGGEEQAIGFYLRYLERDEPAVEANAAAHDGALPPARLKVLAEFAEVCEVVPERELKPSEAVRRHLRAYGVGRMNARLLARYAALATGEDAWREIAEAIEASPERPASETFRPIYFDALHAVKAWERIVDIATAADLEHRTLALIVAEAHAALGNAAEATQLVSELAYYEPKELDHVLRILFRVMPDATAEAVFQRLTGFGITSMLLIGFTRNYERKEAEPGFKQWLGRLRQHAAASLSSAL
jgi:MinD-like ATPase involved in chromosome partitioning or flagellar assembly